MQNDKFSKILKSLRKEKGVTQANLSDILQISQKTIAHLENNYRNPSCDLLIKIADFFNVSLDYLVGRTDNPQINQ